MKTFSTLSPFKTAVILIALMLGSECYAQFNRGQGGNGLGRQRSTIPQAQDTPEPPEPKTADELVDEQMPSITEALELNDFETAVMGAILKKYVQERIELQILKLPPEKTNEAFIKISERQTAELQASLPPEKYEAFVNLQQEGVSKTIKKKKKAEKRKNKKKDQLPEDEEEGR